MNLLFVPCTSIDSATWATIGVFDGLHIGHRYLLRNLKRRKGRLVFTFHPHPCDVLTGRHLPLILPYRRRIELLERMGFLPVVIEFSSDLAKMKAEEFLKEIERRFGVKKLLVCKNFTLGSDRRQAEDLPEWFEVLPPKERAGERISSTRIRGLLSQGQIDQARALLGYWPKMWGRVVPGDGLGRRIGFPTANLEWEGDLLIPFGVYAVKVRTKGRVWTGVMSVGNRPTVGGREVRVEIHILDFDGNLYNKELEVSIRAFLREQKEFSSIDHLREAIERDVAGVKDLVRRQNI